VVNLLREDVARFAGDAPLADDVTVIAMRWAGASGR
jgi:hypothetical protein